MDPNCDPGPPPRSKSPKDGWGPRGAPDCYYTSRVLDSTYRYVRFVKKLRALEEEARRGELIRLQEVKDKQTLDFFSRCDRKALIKSVEQRVKLCLASYEMDLEDKRRRLKDLLTNDEEANYRKFAEVAQAGVEAVWQDKKDRLAYLLAKRKKEHDDRYKLTPLSKCPNLYPCLLKIQCKEAQEIHLYQMREKQMRKLAEMELEKMWHDVAMKESEALAARMELDVIERHRRDLECKQYTDHQLEMRRQERERERERLRQEAVQLRAMMENNATLEAEEKRAHQEQTRQRGEEKEEMRKERQDTLAKRRAEDELVDHTWESLATQSHAQDLAKEEERKKKQRDQNECNRKLAQMRDRIEEIKHNNEPLIEAEGARLRDEADLRRCQIRKKSQQAQRDNVAAMVQQAAERRGQQAAQRERGACERRRERRARAQRDALVRHRRLADAHARTLYQSDLNEQIAYNDLLKERARQEQINELKKCQIVTQEYEQELCNMLTRPFFSEQVHPFMKRMATGLRLQDKCPCSLPNYCAETPPPPKAGEDRGQSH